jgi:quinohemoprotein amine dehydrogenase
MNPLRIFGLPLATLSFLSLPCALGQAVADAAAHTIQIPAESEPGIPVTDKLTIEKCSECHHSDDKGNLTRISWNRTTPEGWEEAVKRMVRLNGLTLNQDEARHIISYLAANHGLAPEEVAPYRWYLEMRQPESEEIPSAAVRVSCASCHAFARPQTWRRSATEWKLLVNMHLGYFPVTEYNTFHARPRPEGGVLQASIAPAGTTPAKEPVDEAVDYLTKGFALHSEAWSSWRAAARDPDLTGRWLITASAAGKGKYYGVLTVSPGDAAGYFKTEATLTRIADGSKTSFAGQSVVYSGYEWRGRAKTDSISEGVRQVMAISADQSQITGRWFWGGYHEFGFDATARRESNDPTVLSTDVSSIKAGSKAVAVKIFGDKFPKTLTPIEVDLGSGVHVTRVVSVTANEIDVVADVDPAMASGFRGVSINHRVSPNIFAVYDKIDYIKISEPSALARLGGNGHPKGFVQFEAIAYNRGVDGTANTADDIPLGPIQVKWSMEEFIARYNDDDKEFVGSLSADGLFTPAAEGPNPQRRFSTNNTGDVWVVAKYQDKDTPVPLVAKSYLVVTVPVYMQWDEPEVAQ